MGRSLKKRPGSYKPRREFLKTG